MSDLHQYMIDVNKRVSKAMLSRLQIIGEQFINDARSKSANEAYGLALRSLSQTRGTKKASLEAGTPSFNDRTGNLRSSIGYLISHNGEFEISSFSGRDVGELVGLAFAKQFFEASPGYVLILVAGMDYAAAVESLGYDVITGSTQRAEASLRLISAKDIIDNV